MNIIEGDLLKMAMEGRFDVVIQPQNCISSMGGNQTGKKLGTFSTKELYHQDGSISLVIITAYIKYKWTAQTDKISYPALQKCFNQIRRTYGHRNIAYPLIGTGLIGANQDIIHTMINQQLQGCNHTLVIP